MDHRAFALWPLFRPDLRQERMTTALAIYPPRLSAPRLCLFALLACLVVPLSFSSPALAQVNCDVSINNAAAATQDCANGVNNTAAATNVLEVDNFQGSISPPAGTIGVSLVSDGASKTVSVEITGFDQNNDPLTITTENAIGVQVLNTTGAGTITFNGTLVTTGANAYGLLVNSNGNATITATGTITTEGQNAHAINAASTTGTVTVTNNADLEARAGNGGTTVYAIYARAASDITITNTGTITAEGDSARGISAESTAGNITVINNGPITSGNEGIYAKADNGTIMVTNASTIRSDGDGIHAEATGTITINNEANGTITTSDDGSSGILALTTGAGSTVTVENHAAITGGGDDSFGIQASADGQVTIETSADVTAPGEDGTAIQATSANGNVDIDVTGANVTASGEDGTAIRATSTNGDVDIDMDNANVTANGLNGVAIEATAGAGQTIDINNGSGAVRGGSGTGAGIILNGGSDNNKITNAGTITATRTTNINAPATAGLAIRGSANIDTIENSGTGIIEGRVEMGAGDDVFNNDGTFLAGSTSDFGAGTDTLTNKGILGIVNYETGADHAVINNLETLDNTSGTISLQNSTFGDTLTLSGDYNGGGNLNVDATSREADKLILQGTVTGTTTINVTFVPARQVPLADGIPIVDVTAGTTDDDDFKLSVDYLRDGFYDYYLRLNDDIWALRGQLNPLAEELPMIAVGAQELWHASNLPWHAWSADPDILNCHNRGFRYGDDVLLSPHASGNLGDRSGGGGRLYNDGRGCDVRSALWLSAHGALHDLNSSGGVSGDQVITGLQGGVALSVHEGRSIPGTLVAGVTGGFIHSTLEMDVTKTKITYSGHNFGAYLNYYYGPFYAGILAKADWITAEFDENYGKDESADVLAMGLSATAGAYLKPAGRDIFFEPSVRLSVVQTDTDGFSNGAQRVSIDDDYSIQARGGARVGYHGLLIDEMDYKIYFSGSHTVETNGDSKVTLVDTRISDSFIGNYTEVGIGGQASSLGMTAFFDAAYRFGGRVKGFNGKIGGRVTW